MIDLPLEDQKAIWSPGRFKTPKATEPALTVREPARDPAAGEERVGKLPILLAPAQVSRFLLADPTSQHGAHGSMPVQASGHRLTLQLLARTSAANLDPHELAVLVRSIF